jgi:hypothetical protein
MAPQPSTPLSTRAKVLLGAAAAAQTAAIGAAHADISRRDESQLHGSKTKWRAIALISVVGPFWYFLRGRR